MAAAWLLSASETQHTFPRALWLGLIAFALQYFVVRELSELSYVKGVLALSHVLLVAVVLLNRRRVAFLVIGAGLALNLLPIYANGGLMPIAPDAVYSAGLTDSSRELATGDRYGAKNVLLDPGETRFYALSDRFPTSFPRPMLYSVGDVVILGGLALLAVTMVPPRYRVLIRPRLTGVTRRTRARLRQGLKLWAARLENKRVRQRQREFIGRWREHWGRFSEALLHCVREGPRPQTVRTLEREKAWLRSNRWRFLDIWVPYTQWRRLRTRVQTTGSGLQRCFLLGPFDPYSNLYDRWGLASILAAAGVRTAEDAAALAEGLLALEAELEELERLWESPHASSCSSA